MLRNEERPHIKNTARFNRLALAVSLLWTSALGSVVLMTLASGGPAGNNGTIKVDNAPFDNHPNNEPHVDCSFQVDFYGYDKGKLYADVKFEQQSPTDGGQMTVIGNKRVFIGGDDNSGGGSIAGLDASENYRLVFTGIDPHPQQGYHVKLTIKADGSQGADVKHKVFWVEPCATEPTPTPAVTPKPSNTPKPSVTPAGSTTPKPTNTPKPTATPKPTGTVNPSATPTPTPSPTPVIGAGTNTPTPTPTPGGSGNQSPTPSPTPNPTQPTPVPAANIITGNIKNWDAPVEVGAVRLPNAGSALLLFTILLAVVPANLILIIWAIRRQMEDRLLLEQIMSSNEDTNDQNL